MESPEYWLISIPNGGPHGAGSSQETWATLKQNVASQTNDLAELFHFDVPKLRIGTLDKLMASSDQLAKVDSAIEGTFRKIERTFDEVNVNNEQLTVDGEPVLLYLQQFRWSSAKYPSQRPIDDLHKMLAQNAHKVEEELKEATNVFQEKKQLLNALQRKKGGNLMVADLNDVFTPAVMQDTPFVDSEYLTTVPIVVAKNINSEFLSSYEHMANKSVGFGPADNREAITGSPVVPRSAHKVMEDKEGYSLYVIVVLRAFLTEVKNAAQAQRFMVREFDFDNDTAASTQDQLVKVEIDYNQARNQLLRFCKTHYGEAIIAWVHTKAVRLFVESVLRYGLPDDFLAVLLKPRRRSQDKKVRDKLFRLYSSLDSGGMLSSSAEESVGMGGGGKGGIGAGDEFFPYVNFNIAPGPLS